MSSYNQPLNKASECGKRHGDSTGKSLDSVSQSLSLKSFVTPSCSYGWACHVNRVSHKAPWWYDFHGAWHCLCKRGDDAASWEMWASQECQLTGKDRDTKHTSYNSHGGAFLNWNGGLLAKHFHCLVKSQYFPWEKKTKTQFFFKKRHFSAQLYPVKVWETPRNGLLLREFFQGPTEIDGGNHIWLGTNHTTIVGPQERSGKPIHVWFRLGLD